MANTGLKSPTSTGEDYNQWSTPNNAYTSNDSYAEELSNNQSQDYFDFSFGIPADATIDGIQVDCEAVTSSGDAEIEVDMSWDSGPNYTTTATQRTITTIESTHTYGGPTETWGRTWSQGEFSNANFRVRVTLRGGIGYKMQLDHIQVTVYYTEVTGTNMQINIGDAWKSVDGIKINIGDVWKDVTGMQVNIGDSWKTIF